MNRGLKAIQLPAESLRKFQLIGEQLQESVRPQFQAISDMVRSVQASWSKLAGTFQQNLGSPLSLGTPEKRAAIKQLSNEKGSTASNVLNAIIARPGSSAKELGKETGLQDPTIRQAIHRNLNSLGVYNSGGGYQMPWWFVWDSIVKSLLGFGLSKQFLAGGLEPPKPFVTNP